MSLVQSILFDKTGYTQSEAIDWLKKHNFKFNKLHTTAKYLRFRQFEPKGYIFKTISVARDIKFVVTITQDKKKKKR